MEDLSAAERRSQIAQKVLENGKVFVADLVTVSGHGNLHPPRFDPAGGERPPEARPRRGDSPSRQHAHRFICRKDGSAHQGQGTDRQGGRRHDQAQGHPAARFGNHHPAGDPACPFGVAQQQSDHAGDQFAAHRPGSADLAFAQSDHPGRALPARLPGHRWAADPGSTAGDAWQTRYSWGPTA